MFKEELYIAEGYKLQDYLNIGLNINSSEEIWEKAIKMFKSRIKGRYFDAIDKLLEENIYKYGFAIMALECLLIDTLVKFRYGPNRMVEGMFLTRKIVSRDQSYRKYIYTRENKVRFRRFLEEFFISDKDNSKLISAKFYEDIRCGIMHYGLTENSSRLTCDRQKLFTILDNGDISVDVFVMRGKLKEYFNSYIKEIKNEKNIELRENFIFAMNYSCNICEKT